METTSQVNNNVEEATRQLQLQSHIDNIQEAIDVMLLLVPEEEELDSRTLRALSGLEHTKRYLQEQEKKMIEELLQKQLHEGKISWLEYIEQSEHSNEFRQYCQDNGLAADTQTAQQFFDAVMREEEQNHRRDALKD
ncbi:MAG: hypothetical protein IJ552_00925 [Prevotella sp.]|nr:hypothetical protein [Prevotella sp.]